MGRISDEDIQRVRDATDVASLIGESIVLKQKGRLFWGLCPFHGEKTPSFKVDPSLQLWKCFGCGEGGDVFRFVMKTENVDFPDAVRILADRANIELHEEAGGIPRSHKERVVACCGATADYYHRLLTGSRDPGPKAAREYLAGRGFGSDVAKAWQLGYSAGHGSLVKHLTAEGYSVDEMVDANVAMKTGSGALKDRFYERVMFPIRDLNGRVIAFGGRILGSGEPKYLNSSDTPVFKKSANLYAIDRAKGTIVSTGTAIVTEGYTDVIALHSAGLTNAVATLGTALTRQHIKLLGRFARRIVYLFDGDEAGMRAADRAVEFVDLTAGPEAGNSRVELSMAIIPQGMDPADFVATQGPEAMNALVDSAEPLLRFAIDRRLGRWDLDRPEERNQALPDAAAVLAPLKGSLLAQDYAAYIAGRLFTTTDKVIRAIEQTRVAPLPAEEPSQEPAAAVEVLTPQLRAERDLLTLSIRHRELRGEARQLLADDLLTDSRHVTIAEVIAEAPSGVEAPALIGMVAARLPDASNLISSADEVPEEDAGVAAMAAGLHVRLKEFALERRIAAKKARLRDSRELKAPGEDDELLKEISALQRELDALRRGGTTDIG